jgi:hypothetical protein
MEAVAQNVRALPAVKWIFDASFRYTPSYATDVRKTFERIRREMEPQDRDAAPFRKVAVLRLDLRKAVATREKATSPSRKIESN